MGFMSNCDFGDVENNLFFFKAEGRATKCNSQLHVVVRFTDFSWFSWFVRNIWDHFKHTTQLNVSQMSGCF